MEWGTQLKNYKRARNGFSAPFREVFIPVLSQWTSRIRNGIMTLTSNSSVLRACWYWAIFVALCKFSLTRRSYSPGLSWGGIPWASSDSRPRIREKSSASTSMFCALKLERVSSVAEEYTKSTLMPKESSAPVDRALLSKAKRRTRLFSYLLKLVLEMEIKKEFTGSKVEMRFNQVHVL